MSSIGSDGFSVHKAVQLIPGGRGRGNRGRRGENGGWWEECKESESAALAGMFSGVCEVKLGIGCQLVYSAPPSSERVAFSPAGFLRRWVLVALVQVHKRRGG